MDFEYHLTQDNTISIDRYILNESTVIVPDTIEGYPVVTLGDRCFSRTDTAADILEIILPDTIQKIGDLCFYNLRGLRSIELGGGDISIGSDAFMNCTGLDSFVFRVSISDKTALRSILMGCKHELTAEFTDAKVLFLEYSESYDLIGPAHIFELNIEGQGLRMRQSFEDGVFKPEGYDAAFLKACDTEAARTLVKLAVYRLRYPYGLTSENRDRYRAFLLDNLDEFASELISARDISLIDELGRQGLIDEAGLQIILKMMVGSRWVEGTTTLLRMKSGWQGA